MPSRWTEAYVKDVCELLNGRAYKRNELLEGGKYPVLRVGNFFSNRSWYYSDIELEPEKYCDNGDLLYAWSASFGPKIWDGGKVIFHYHIWRVDLVTELVEKRFLFYWFEWDKENIKSDLGTGSTMIHVTKGGMETRPFLLPPPAEQRRIVAKVDGLTARTARARGELDRIPTLIARYKQRLLALAFSGDLTAGWRKDKRLTPNLNKIVVAERKSEREKHGIKTKGRNRSIPKSEIALQSIPSSWTWLTFNDCAWNLTVGHVGPMKDRYVTQGIPFLRSLNVRSNRIDLSKVVFIDKKFQNELKKSQIQAGDLVVVRTGAPGTAAVVPESLGTANCSDLVIAKLVPSLNPHFAAYYMNSEFAKKAVAGMQVGIAQQHFNVGAMSKMPIPLAPLEEQTEIVRQIEVAFGWLDRIAVDHAAAKRLLPKLDAAILAQAFRGELVPQDPNDEPAAELLKRIKAERAAAPKKTKKRRSSKSPILASSDMVLVAAYDNSPRSKGGAAVARTLKDVLSDADDWMSAQDAYQRCGVGTTTEDIEVFYAEIRELDKMGRLEAEPVNDKQGRKLHDRLRLKAA